MDIVLCEEVIGRIYIILFRDVFPAGVENFFKIASNRTYRVDNKGSGNYKFKKETLRTFEGCKFYNLRYNNYIVSGDIYNNNGTEAGTIYNDQPIPAWFGDCYYPHESKGLVSLVPFRDAATGELFFDSTFMITLDNVRPNNTLSELDNDQIVIGQVYQGMDVIDKINKLIKPYAGRRYPDFRIGKTDIYRNATTSRRIRPITSIERNKLLHPSCYKKDCEKKCDHADDHNCTCNT